MCGVKPLLSGADNLKENKFIHTGHKLFLYDVYGIGKTFPQPKVVKQYKLIHKGHF